MFKEKLEKALSLAKKGDLSGFDKIYSFDEYGFAQVELNNKYNFIDKKCNLLSQQWFDTMFGFNKNGFAVVVLNNKYNFIDVNGNLLSKQWFDSFDESFDYFMKMVSL